ncbi:MAG TPA: sensor domain-containing diguanylate cyclase [Phycisphaerae bacterium]|nr:sensor domain-containing diguanylate cyclase [Phycisphaerae bacterium]
MEFEYDMYREVLDQVADGVYFVDPQRRIIMWNKAAERITGYSAADVVGRRCSDNILMHVDDQGTCLCLHGCPLSQCMADGNRRTAKVYLHHKDGQRVPVEMSASATLDGQGRIIGAVETFRDVSTHQAELERLRELEQLVFIDELTGVANRRFLEASLRARLAEVRRGDLRFGFLMIDLDHFKRINDRFGHQIGDSILKVVAATLSGVSRPFDLVARWGGEEFVVIITKVAPEHLELVANRLRILVAHSGLKTRGNPLSVTISIGATIVALDDDLESLMGRTDKLLYAAKNAGRNRVVTDCVQTSTTMTPLEFTGQLPILK